MATSIQFKIDEPINTGALLHLFAQTDWANERNADDVETMLRFTTFHIAAYFEDKLVGFLRALTDFRYRAFIEDVVVDASYRQTGIGKKLMEIALQQLQNVDEVVLGCTEKNVSYYELFEFKQVTHPYMQKNNNL